MVGCLVSSWYSLWLRQDILGLLIRWPLSSQIQVRENAIKTATEVCCSFVDRSTSLCLLKMSARLVYLGLLVFLEPESTYIFTRFLTTIVLKSKKYFVKMQECLFRKYFAMLRMVWNELSNWLAILVKFPKRAHYFYLAIS